MEASTRTLAARLLSRMTTAKRDNGDAFVKYDHDGPDADILAPLVQDAHGDMLPDDYRYTMVRDCLEAIANADEDADEDDVRDDMEPPVYTAELLRWAASHSSRIGWLDEALSVHMYAVVGEVKRHDKQTPSSMFNLLQHAYSLELAEVYDNVLGSLRTFADAEDDE